MQCYYTCVMYQWLRYDCEIITESLQLHNIAHQDHDSRCVPGAMRVTFRIDTVIRVSINSSRQSKADGLTETAIRSLRYS